MIGHQNVEEHSAHDDPFGGLHYSHCADSIGEAHGCEQDLKDMIGGRCSIDFIEQIHPYGNKELNYHSVIEGVVIVIDAGHDLFHLVDAVRRQLSGISAEKEYDQSRYDEGCKT